MNNETPEEQPPSKLEAAVQAAEAEFWAWRQSPDQPPTETMGYRDAARSTAERLIPEGDLDTARQYVDDLMVTLERLPEGFDDPLVRQTPIATWTELARELTYWAVADQLQNRNPDLAAESDRRIDARDDAREEAEPKELAGND